MRIYVLKRNISTFENDEEKIQEKGGENSGDFVAFTPEIFFWRKNREIFGIFCVFSPQWVNLREEVEKKEKDGRNPEKHGEIFGTIYTDFFIARFNYTLLVLRIP